MATLKISDDLKNAIKQVVLDTYYPIGKIYITVGEEDPNESIGGEWIRFASGRTLIGVDTSDIKFTMVEQIGGSNRHNHQFMIGYHPFYGVLSGDDANMIEIYDLTNKKWVTGNQDDSLDATGYTNSAIQYKSITISRGVKYSVAAHTSQDSSLSPYITVFMWKRIA